ncbi:hypothetical protein AYK26_00820 [Euryarchaeota archaeon SM23-78]|nr:MAG: hypothetical protein AYK26_00820 [Euryarchaeota archaeon SM23-78]MBW3001113.1 hypothetical protein [Candidatus Woesearchaeota archaeon]
MVLPKGFNIEEVEKGIRELVINLNRIPGVRTIIPTCEGHVYYYDFEEWPAKEGIISFCAEKHHSEWLVETIKDFCGRIEYFEFKGPQNQFGKTYYEIIASFESHHDDKLNDLFGKMGVREQMGYVKRAKKRKNRILAGWKRLNDLVEDYIKQNISEDVESLPYREPDYVLHEAIHA